MAAPAHAVFNNSDSAEYAAAVTKSDDTVLSPIPRAFYIGVGGDVTATMATDNTDIVFKNLQSGSVLPIRATKIKAATTATDIVALY